MNLSFVISTNLSLSQKLVVPTLEEKKKPKKKSFPVNLYQMVLLKRQLTKSNKIESMTCLLDIFFLLLQPNVINGNVYYKYTSRDSSPLISYRWGDKKVQKTFTHSKPSINKEKLLENLLRHSV